MHARNPRTGSPIVATLERVHGRTPLVPDGFRKDEDGVVEREIAGPTEMDWTTSTTTGYLDADDEHVDFDDIEVYEPESNASPRPADTQDTPSAGRAHDPAAIAGNSAACAVERILDEVDGHHDHVRAIRKSGHDRVDKAIDEAHDEFGTNATVGVERIEITSSLRGPRTSPENRHAERVCIHLKTRDAVRIHCERMDPFFHVNEVVATEHGHESRCTPTKRTTARLDYYANTIIGAWTR